VVPREATSRLAEREWSEERKEEGKTRTRQEKRRRREEEGVGGKEIERLVEVKKKEE
jgi:hypothetical protein